MLDGLWLRILDLPAAHVARSYVGGGSLVLEVSADVRGERRSMGAVGRRRAGHGLAHVQRPRPRSRLAALAATYLGAFRFADLANAGHVRDASPAR